MRVLVVGSGGREHALAWGLRASPAVREVAAAPGNPGIAEVARLVPADLRDVEGLAAIARDGRFDLVVVGPEALLAAGLADRVVASGIPVFGCSAAAARIEASKSFAKRLMRRRGVPTADFEVFDEADAAARALLGGRFGAGAVVVKADGLAGGKGSFVCADPVAAAEKARDLLGGRLGPAGRRVVVEERLVGREASVMALVDGDRLVVMDACEDHKPRDDGDRGPMTGSMGAVSPAPAMSPERLAEVTEGIVRPVVEGLAEEGAPFRGLLYAGVMLTEDGPRALEINCRFGDPEAQALIVRLDGDLADLLTSVALGQLPPAPAFRGASCCVVLAAEGYPDAARRGDPIDGLAQARAVDGVEVFHAGTRQRDGRLLTDGGRVLGVTALAATAEEARRRAYAAVDRIRFPGMICRRDIGARLDGGAR